MRLIRVLIACCLLVATSGCSVQRPSDGSIFSNPWLQTSDHAPWFKFRSATDADTGSHATDSYAADTGDSAADKPEVLPWRSRLKAYRSTVRVAHAQKSTGSPNSSQTAATSDAKTLPLETPPSPAISDDLSAAGGQAPAKSATELQLPASVGSRPESNRPDFVVD